MSRFAILTSHLKTGDAIGNDVLGMCRILEKHGHEPRMYAQDTDFEKHKVWPLSEISDFLRNPDDVFIYHHSIGWDTGITLLQQLQCRKVVRYHNVTPPEFFAGISKWHEERCVEGQKQLETIVAAGCDLYLSASEYNSQDFLRLGVSEARSFVVPPVNQLDALQSTPADLDVMDTYRDGKANILSVGKVAPHKNQAALIEAFAIYHHDHNFRSRLLIVGREDEPFKSYSTRLRDLIKFLCLDDAVVFAGELSDQALKACYLLSNVFMLASNHEGFSVPLVEAMALKVPIVSYGVAAVPETVGDAGIILETRDPLLMAQAVNLLVEDEAMNVALGIKGRLRYEQCFTNAKIETRFLRALESLN
jgi:glycosyltransferase involved in cell wall biosynthesis